jgi:hypothetical protein
VPWAAGWLAFLMEVSAELILDGAAARIAAAT